MQKIKIYTNRKYTLIFGIVMALGGILLIYDSYMSLGILFLICSLPALFICIHPKFTFLDPNSEKHPNSIANDEQQLGTYIYEENGFYNKYNHKKWFNWSDIAYIKAFVFETVDTQCFIEIHMNQGNVIKLHDDDTPFEFLSSFEDIYKPIGFNTNWYQEIVYPHYLKTKEEHSFIKMFYPIYYPKKPIIYRLDKNPSN